MVLSTEVQVSSGVLPIGHSLVAKASPNPVQTDSSRLMGERNGKCNPGCFRRNLADQTSLMLSDAIS